MKCKTLTAATGAALVLTAALLSGSTITVLAQNAKKTAVQKAHAKPTKTAGEVKYKAQCGMVYSAADAKKYHNICPMDHKPLTKIASSTAVHHPSSH